MRAWWSVACLSLLSAACDGGDCSDEIKIALEVHIDAPDSVTIDKVTAELTDEEDCTFIRTKTGHLYTCLEQGGGPYVVRVYSGGDVVYSEMVDVAADKCHIEQRVTTNIDLTEP